MQGKLVDHDYENRILSIINEYLEKNRTFEIEKMVPIISSRFSKSSYKLNRRGIIKHLETLVKKKVIVEGSKLTRARVIANKNRCEIYYCIVENPGIYFNKLLKILDLKPTILEWHINILLKFACINEQKIDNRTVYYKYGYNFETKELLHFLSREKYQKIITFLKQNTEGITQTKLSSKLGMHPATIKKYLKNLEGFNLVIKKKLSSKSLFFLNQDYYSELKSNEE